MAILVEENKVDRLTRPHRIYYGILEMDRRKTGNGVPSDDPVVVEEIKVRLSPDRVQSGIVHSTTHRPIPNPQPHASPVERRAYKQRLHRGDLLLGQGTSGSNYEDRSSSDLQIPILGSAPLGQPPSERKTHSTLIRLAKKDCNEELTEDDHQRLREYYF